MEDFGYLQLEGLYFQMYPLLFEYAWTILADDALAEEAVQEVFAVACQKLDLLSASENPQGWMMNALKNVISDIRRCQSDVARVRQSYLAALDGKLPASNERLRFELLYEDLAQTEEFRLVKERVLDGRSYEELAAERGISEATCRKRMQRAKEFLRKKLQP